MAMLNNQMVIILSNCLVTMIPHRIGNPFSTNLTNLTAECDLAPGSHMILQHLYGL